MKLYQFPIESSEEPEENPFMPKNLEEMMCTACESDPNPVSSDELNNVLGQIPSWSIINEEGTEKLQRLYSLPDFKSAFKLAQMIGDIAEQENHHPALLIEWGKLTVTWWTHSINGLHINDLILAARTDQLISKEKK